VGYVDYNQQTGAVEITYGGREAPFMGIDSTAPDPYIGPNQLTQDSINALVNNNTLIATFWQQYAFVAAGAVIVGFGDLNGQVFSVTYDLVSGNIVIEGYPNWPSLAGQYAIQIINTTAILGAALNLAIMPNTLTYKNINGVCYFSFPGCPFIFQHNNQTGNVLTTYLGASFLSEINGRLIAANVWQITNISSNGFSPANQITGIDAFANNGGTQTQNSTALTFGSQAVGAGQLVNLNITLQGTFNCNPQFNPGNSGSFKVQISKDSGTTWNDAGFQWNASNANDSTGPQQVTIAGISGLTNLNTLEVRLSATASAASGEPSISASINCSTSACTASIGGVPATVTISNFPFQYAWSAGQGQYGQFNALTTDSNGNIIATGAGYNNLPDVEDVITGLFNTGPTQFVLRSQGITEVTALSNGINPFEFDHLWASHKGIGTVFPETVGQYGSMGAFFSDTGIFTFGYEGINEIGGKASSAIYTDLITTCEGNLIAGGLGPIFINGEVYLAYVLAAVNPNTNVVYVWMYNSKNKEWFRFQQQLPRASSGLQIIGVNLGTIPQTQANSLFINVLVDGGESSFTLTLPINGFVATGLIGGLTVIPSNFIFPAEEIKADRDVTIHGIMVYYNCLQEVGELLGTFRLMEFCLSHWMY